MASESPEECLPLLRFEKRRAAGGVKKDEGTGLGYPGQLAKDGRTVGAGDGVVAPHQVAEGGGEGQILQRPLDVRQAMLPAGIKTASPSRLEAVSAHVNANEPTPEPFEQGEARAGIVTGGIENQGIG